MGKSLEEMKAEFAARGGQVRAVEAAPAYGVDPQADKARRQTQREQREYDRTERNAERYAEQTREAYHVGGSRARDEVVSGWRF